MKSKVYTFKPSLFGVLLSHDSFFCSDWLGWMPDFVIQVLNVKRWPRRPKRAGITNPTIEAGLHDSGESLSVLGIKDHPSSHHASHQCTPTRTPLPMSTQHPRRRKIADPPIRPAAPPAGRAHSARQKHDPSAQGGSSPDQNARFASDPACCSGGADRRKGLLRADTSATTAPS